MNAQPKALSIATRAERIFKVLEGNETVPTMRVMEFMLEAADEVRRLQTENEHLKGNSLAAAFGVEQGLLDHMTGMAERLAKAEALLRQALEALETDAWQKKLQAAINIRQHLAPQNNTIKENS